MHQINLFFVYDIQLLSLNFFLLISTKQVVQFLYIFVMILGMKEADCIEHFEHLRLIQKLNDQRFDFG